MNSLEKATQEAALQLLTAKRIFHYRQNTGSYERSYTTKNGVAKKSYIAYGTPGATDILAVIKGKYVGIEIKDTKGKQSEDQVKFQEALEKAGGTYLLIRNIDDLIQFLEKL
jgi:penicillin-binding protein-related factor A (putative recombinase)